MSLAEPIQEQGRSGVIRTKRWLESTTWIELPFNAYHNQSLCRLTRLDGETKLYDLFGYIFGTPPVPVYVEAKNYTSAGGKQPAEFQQFLANAYSITARDLADDGDGMRQFMWVTTHPFSMTDWNDQLTPGQIQKSLDKHPNVLAGKHVDVDVLKLVSERVWLLVLHEKQEKFLLTPQELHLIEAQLNRKAEL